MYGALLNGAIFNLCSSDASIRMAALSFLQGLTQAMHIDKLDDIVPSSGNFSFRCFVPPVPKVELQKM